MKSKLSFVLVGVCCFIFNLDILAQTSPAKALSLNGVTGDYVRIPNNVPISGDFTVESWVYVRSYNSYSRLIDFANGANNGNVYLALSSSTTGNPVAGVFTNTGLPVVTATNQIPLGQWAHLALTLSGTNGTIYINGNVAGAGVLNIPPNITRATNYIGRSMYSSDGPANAAFQEIRIWNVARSQSEIQATMNRQLRGNESGLVAYWKCNQNSGATLTNYSTAGSLYNGTLFGAATFTNSGAPINIQCAVGTTNLFEGPAAGSDTVTLGVTPLGLPWTATANALWLTAVTASGNGSTNVLFSFTTNSGPTRTGTLTLSTASTNFTVTVTQTGSNYMASPHPFTVLADAPYLNGLAVDPSGNVYFSSSFQNLIYKWTASDNTRSIALSGPGKPDGLALDGAGNLYISENSSNVVSRWTPGSGLPRTNLITNLTLPTGVAVDSAGTIFSPDLFNNLKRWTPTNQALTTLTTSNLLSSVSQVSLDAAGNVYLLSGGRASIVVVSAETGKATNFLSAANTIQAVTVDGSGNVYTTFFDPDSFTFTLKEWVAASNTWVSLGSSGLNNVFYLVLDSTGNIFVGNSGTAQLAEMPRAFIDSNTHVEGPDAGTDSLAPVIPATQNLRPPFQPSSDSDWLSITGVTNGVVSFAFTSTTTNRTGYINLLGQPIAVTQIAPLSPSTLFGATMSGNGTFQFSITNSGSPSSLVVLASTNLLLPLSNWTIIGTATNVSSGLYQFTDPHATNSPRYYNVLSQ